MTDWVHNRWTVRLNTNGTAEDLKDFLQLMTTGRYANNTVKREVTFQKIRPIPGILIRIGLGTITDREGRPIPKPLSDEEQQQVAATGAKDAGDWARKNWGTSSDATDTKLNPHGKELRIRFKTAGHPPMPVISAMCKRFPNLLFIVSCETEAERKQRLDALANSAPDAPGVH